MATEEKIDSDVTLILEQGKPPEEAPVTIPDKDMSKVYSASEANAYLNDQLLEQDEETGEIVSLVENVVPDGDFDVTKPVMPRGGNRTMNTFESLIPKPELQAIQEAGAMGADTLNTAVRIIGGSAEDAIHNSLKYFYSLTPDYFQDAFEQSMFGQGGGVAGITGTEQQFEASRLFPHMGGVVEEVARGIGQFAWGMKGAGMLLNTKKAIVARGAISDMTVFNPDHGNLASLIREMDFGPEALQDLAAYIDSTEPGTETEKRARMAAEGIILSGVIAGAMKSPKAAKEIYEWGETFFGEGGTGRPAVDKVVELLSEMKKKWPSDSSFREYLNRHLGNEAGSIPGPRSGEITKLFIRSPWDEKIIFGGKTLEVRGRAIPAKHIGVPIVLKNEKNEAIGEVVFKGSRQIKTAKEFNELRKQHQVEKGSEFDFGSRKETHVWEIASVKPYTQPQKLAPMKGQAPFQTEIKPKKKTKVKKLSRTEETGTLNTIYPEVNQAMEETMSRMDPAEAKMLRENMEQHAGTPWAAATVRGLTIREFFHRTMEGRLDEAMELANSKLWGKDALTNYAMGKAFAHSKEAVLEFAGSYSFIGKNRKAELDISGSFKNCNPSADCAKWCYASIANARPAELMKAEFTEWVAENHPEILAKRVGALYSATPQGMTGLALRINDKGDLSEGQVKLIKAMNKQGHRIQIFSKRPDMLAKVPDFNLKMMSIDSTNFELTRKHPEYQLAVTITEDMTPEMIAEVNDRVAVYLPVNMKGGEVTRADVKKRFPKTFSKMTKKLCPVDGGKMKTKPGTSFVSIANKTAEPGLWTCTSCDKFGAAGCFFGKNQTENAKKINNQNKQANSQIK